MKKVIGSCIIILVFTTYVYNAPIGWRNELLIENIQSLNQRTAHAISVSGGVIHIISQAGTPEAECHFPHYYHSFDGGFTWPSYTPPGTIPATTFLGRGSHPAIFKAQDGYYTFWQDRISASPKIDELYFKKSQDGDNWWSYNPEPGRIDSAQRITYTNGKSNYPDIASGMLVENGQECQFLHLVWSKLQYTPYHDYEIYYNFSNNGEDWTYGGDGYRITNTDRRSLFPAVACYSLNISVHCVWQEGEGDEAQIWYAGSMNNGQIWSEPMMLAFGEHPDIAVDHQGVHIVFSSHWLYPSKVPQYIESGIYCYINSSDYGFTWGSITQFTNTLYDSLF